MVLHHDAVTKPSSFPVSPNLSDWAAARSSTGWSEIEKELDWLPGGGLNLAHEAIDRHCLHGNAEKLLKL